MQSKASSVEDYLKQLPEDRKEIITSLRKTISKNLPKGFEECMNYGMIGYVVPHSLYPAGYHCDPKLPLPFISLASQKNYISVYHMGLYGGELLDWFRVEWSKFSTKKLDMGKCCIRFKKAEDVPLQLIGELCTKVSAKQWISYYEAAIKNRAAS